MRSGVSGRLDMAARVRSFSRTHPSMDPGYAKVLGRFEERLTRAEEIAARQHEGLVLAKSARARREEIRKVVHFQLLRHLVSIGGITAKTRTELAERFKLPATKATNRVFLTSVRSMLSLAEEQQDALVSEGMSPTLLEQLGRMLAEFEAASEAARVARLGHIGARGELEEVTAQLMESVTALDGHNRLRFGKAPELLVDWNAAKHLPARARVGIPPVAGGEGTGEVPPSGGVAPAA